MNRLKIALLVSLIVVSIVSCKKQDNPISPNTNWKEDLTASLDSLSNQLLTNDQVLIKNAIFKVVVPSKDYEWNSSWGYANPNQSIVATEKDQFYIASIGKMTLATLTMLFVEQGQLNLNDPIKMYLPDLIMTGLHTYNGTDYSGQITIKHLLGHTSGLQDYFFDGDAHFLELVFAQPNKIWQPFELIDYAKTNLPPLFSPGDGYHYTDTEYVLMGIILENITQMDLAQIYRQKLWEPLKMNQTYLFLRETAIPSVTGASFAHAFLNNLNLTASNVLSADWAGGGLIATTEDLYKFMFAWVNNDIFQHPETKQLMTKYNPVSDYGLGHERNKPSGFEGTLVGHDGANDSFMYYIPEYKAYIIGTFNQLEGDTHLTFIKKTLVILKKQFE